MKHLNSLSQSQIAFLRQLYTTVVTSSVPLSYGLMAGYTAQAILSLKNGKASLDLSSIEIRWLSCVLPLVAGIVSILSAPLCNIWGRKRLLIASTIPVILGWLLMSYANNGTLLLLGRTITSILGGIDPITYSYISEISSSSYRGFFESTLNVAWRLGFILSYVIGSFVEWNWLAFWSILIPIFQLLTSWPIKCSPRWLVSRHREDEAKDSLLYYRGNEWTDDVETEFNNLNHLSHEMNNNPLFQMFRLRKRVFLCLLIHTFIVLTGFPVIDFHGKQILIEAQVMSNLDPNLGLVLIGLGALIGNIISTFLIDRTGRKNLLYISSFFIVFSQIGLGIYFTLKQQSNVDLNNFRIFPFICLLFFVLFFSIGWGSVAFILPSEIVPTSIRSSTVLFINVWEQILIFIQLYLHDTIYETIGPEYLHLFFGVCSIFGGIFVLKTLPETAGKTLEEIEFFFTSPETKPKFSGKEENNNLSKENSSFDLRQKV